MIKKIGNIILVGTSHVAKQSKKEIIKTIDEQNPQVVAIELDIDRFKTLMGTKKTTKKEKKYDFRLIKEIGISGYIFAIIASFVQQKIGKSLGIEPGVDMKTAYIQARKRKIPTALIDMNIRITLKKMSKLSFGKKISMFFNLVVKSFKKEYREKLQFDVKSGVPDEKVISEMIKVVKKEVPDLYKILIHDRNIYMCDKLIELSKKHSEGDIMAVVGAGHVEGMYSYLEEKLNLNSNSINFSFTLES